MTKKTRDPVDEACVLLREALKDRWADDEHRWCAYCGIPMRQRGANGKPTLPQKSTKDHLIPKAHNGVGLTIPACFSCNQAKGAMSLQEFLLSSYFTDKRKLKHKHKWSVEHLWTVAALAALEQARSA